MTARAKSVSRNSRNDSLALDVLAPSVAETGRADDE
jgi:hypothetical protein